MAKAKEFVNTAALRMGNTIATPFRIIGEGGNALANILRQGKSSAKNIAEVEKQTIDALVDNFTNFSKVDGKRYQRLAKGSINFVSAVTRRPFMIMGAGLASSVNQGIRQPFKKLLYTPGKMFKGMRNATRIFSKKKGYDFVKYDTHETGSDTLVNKIKEKRFGFLGKAGSSSKAEQKVEENGEKSKKIEEKKSEEKKSETNKEGKPEIKKEEKPETNKEGKPEIKKEEKPETNKEEKKPESKPQTPASTPSSKPTDKPKSIDEIKEKNKQETQAKDAAAQAKEFPDWKTMDEKMKKQYIDDYKNVLGGKTDEDGILARGKKHKQGDNIDQILINTKKNNPTMAGYFEELLSKKADA